MTTVTCTYDCGAFDFAMVGHAGFAAEGQPDIVCAACSAIGFALLGMLENMEGHVERLRVWEEPGLLRMIGKGDRKAKTCLDMALLGLRQVAEKYPENVFIK